MSYLLNPSHYARKMQRLINDPDLHGDALLFAVAIVEYMRKNALTPQGRLQKTDYREVAHMAFGPALSEFERGRKGLPWRLVSVIRNDVPRYQPPGKPEGCCAPMIRRSGECGLKVHEWVVLRDPETGTGTSHGYCTRHWNLSHRAEERRLRRQWQEAGSPEPEPNTGGILLPHFPAGMNMLYAWYLDEPEPQSKLSLITSEPNPETLNTQQHPQRALAVVT